VYLAVVLARLLVSSVGKEPYILTTNRIPGGEAKKMMYITCVKINPGMTEAARKFGDKLLKEPPKGVKFLQVYHTLGRYDAIWIYEAEDANVIMDFLHKSRNVSTTETWVAFERKK
jgi:uncharacterized protein with GYD domain